MIKSLRHYYGDIVRYLFLAAAVLMIITLPLFQDYIAVPLIISIIGIAVLGLAAGLTNPRQKLSAMINLIIALGGFLIFGYVAVDSFGTTGVDDKFLLTNIILALIFIFALYFSMKTLRAEIVEDVIEE